MDRKTVLQFAMSVVVVAAVIAIFGLVIYDSLPTWRERGQFGDMFGVVNSTFSGLAFAGIILALVLQSKELQYQRLELEATRKVLEASAEAQQQQSKLMGRSSLITALTTLIESAEYDLDLLRARGVNSGDEFGNLRERRGDLIDELYELAE